MNEYVMSNLADTEAFGQKVAKMLEPGSTLALIGEMGTGKTTLTRCIARALGVTEDVTSPTYTIVNEYLTGEIPIYHIDAYRLDGSEEAFGRGVEEYLYGDGIAIVEWADIIDEIMPEDTIRIFLERGNEEGERLIKCTF